MQYTQITSMSFVLILKSQYRFKHLNFNPN